MVLSIVSFSISNQTPMSAVLAPDVRAKHGERSSKHLFAFASRHFSNINEVITNGGTGKDVKAIVTHDQGGGGKDVIT